MDTLGFALAAGALAAVNPCGFAMLPAYLALFIAGDQPPSGRWAALVAVRRALAATAAMTTGFLATFVTAGLILSPIAATLQRWAPALTVVIGVVLTLMGLLMVAGRELTLPLPKPGSAFNPAAGLGPMALYGVVYAVASLGCTIGPFLVVTTTTFTSGDIAAGIAAYGAYALGDGPGGRDRLGQCRAGPSVRHPAAAPTPAVCHPGRRRPVAAGRWLCHLVRHL